MYNITNPWYFSYCKSQLSEQSELKDQYTCMTSVITFIIQVVKTYLINYTVT